MTLRGSSQGVAEKLKAEIQSRADIAGIQILEARITHLAYVSSAESLHQCSGPKCTGIRT
jgi:hypothetical protein